MVSLGVLATWNGLPLSDSFLSFRQRWLRARNRRPHSSMEKVNRSVCVICNEPL